MALCLFGERRQGRFDKSELGDMSRAMVHRPVAAHFLSSVVFTRSGEPEM